MPNATTPDTTVFSVLIGTFRKASHPFLKGFNFAPVNRHSNVDLPEFYTILLFFL
jgi:hypothetical protein